MDLFIEDPRLEFESPNPKVAATQLDEDPSMWPRQILQELFRQVPETSEYVPRVVMVNVDKEQGYGLGAVVIASSTDSAMATSNPGAVQSKQALIPVIVKQNMLQPLDLLMTKNKMRPLTGDRLREALFRPSTFEMMTKDWGDQSLYNLFYPPGRAENDFASGVSVTSSGNSPSAVYGAGLKYAAAVETRAGGAPKGSTRIPDDVASHHWKRRAALHKGDHAAAKKHQAAFEKAYGDWQVQMGFKKKATLLEQVAPTLTQQDLNKLSALIQEDEALKHQLVQNESFRHSIAKLAQWDGQLLSSADPLFRKVEQMWPTHVVQVGYDADKGYWIKQASRKYAYPVQPTYMGRRDFLKVAGPEVATKVDTEGTVTLSQPNQSEGPIETDTAEWDVVTESGIYKVMTEQGKELMGWVIPGLLDLDGTRLPMSVFTNGAAAGIQDQIAGARVAQGLNLPDDPPKGTGVFYIPGLNGVEATVPVAVVGQEAGMDGAEVYHVKTVMGAEHRLKMVPGLKKMMPDQGDGMAMLPDTARFMSLDQETQLPLVSEPSGLAKTSAHIFSPKIRVYSDGLRYGLHYENLPKLASVFPSQNLSYDDATFILCMAGLEPLPVHQALVKASGLRQSTTFNRLYDVRPAREVMDAALAKGEKVASATKGLRRNLVKEAAVLPDIQTVDSVLSLGFINPENVRMYVGHLPYLDRALSSVCELTLASRLGLSEVPEFAAARACRALNEVIEGLKALALREVDESAAA